MAKPKSADSILRNIKKQGKSEKSVPGVEIKAPIAEEMYLPNHSGDHGNIRASSLHIGNLSIDLVESGGADVLHQWEIRRAGATKGQIRFLDDSSFLVFEKDLSNAQIYSQFEHNTLNYIDWNGSAQDQVWNLGVTAGGDFEIKSTLATKGLQLRTGGAVNEFSTDGTFAGNSDTAVPTEKAIKTYVDAQSGGMNNNIIINAFRIAINGSLTQFNMIDGVVDEYQDESGVDTGSSTNEIYDAGDNFYTNASSSETAHYKLNDNAANTTVVDSIGSFDGTASTNTSNLTATGKINEGFTLVSASSEYVALGTSTSLKPGTGDWSMAAWIKLPTGSANATVLADRDTGSLGTKEGFYFKANPGGASGKMECVLEASNNEYKAYQTSVTVSDDTWHHFALSWDNSTDTMKIYVDGSEDTTPTKVNDDVLTGDDISNASNTNIGRRPNNQQYYDGELDDIRVYVGKVLSSGEVSTIYNSGTGTEASLSAAPADMTLISNNTEAETTPTNARIVILHEDVDAVTINTDIKAFASRDDGTTYTQITLADKGDFDANKKIFEGEVDISGQPSDKTMRYKITTHNTKELKEHGTSLAWD